METFVTMDNHKMLIGSGINIRVLSAQLSEASSVWAAAGGHLVISPRPVPGIPPIAASASQYSG